MSLTSVLACLCVYSLIISWSLKGTGQSTHLVIVKDHYSHLVYPKPMHEIKNLWKLKLQGNSERKNILVAQNVCSFRCMRKTSNNLSEKLPLSLSRSKLRFPCSMFRGSHFSQCFIYQQISVTKWVLMKSFFIVRWARVIVIIDCTWLTRLVQIHSEASSACSKSWINLLCLGRGALKTNSKIDSIIYLCLGEFEG